MTNSVRYLMTGYLPGGHMHGYLAVKGGEPLDKLPMVIENARNYLIDGVAKFGDGNPMSMIMLETKLSTGYEIVEAVAAKIPEAKLALDNAKDFLFIMFALPESDADDVTLMELH